MAIQLFDMLVKQRGDYVLVTVLAGGHVYVRLFRNDL